MSAQALPPVLCFEGTSPWHPLSMGRGAGTATSLSVILHVAAGALVALAMTPQEVRKSGDANGGLRLSPLEMVFSLDAGGTGADGADKVADRDLPQPTAMVPPADSARPPVPAIEPDTQSTSASLAWPDMPNVSSLALEAMPQQIANEPSVPLAPLPPVPARALADARPAPATGPTQPSPRPLSPPRRATNPSQRPPRGTAEALPAAASSHGAAPLDTGPPLVTAARFRRPPRPPDYPARAVELELNGTVLIRALLDPEGDPRDVRVHRSSGHALLDQAAVAAVTRWAFEPASRDGQRIAAWVEVPVHFRLR